MELNHPVINTIQQGWTRIEDELPSKKTTPVAALIEKVKESKKPKQEEADIVKKALELKYRQYPTADQVTRIPTAVIVKDDNTKHSQLANRFYSDIAQFIREQKYAVSVESHSNQQTQPKLYINHNARNGPKFAQKGTKVVELAQFEHPVAKAWMRQQNGPPPPHHYFFNKEMRDAIIKQIKK